MRWSLVLAAACAVIGCPVLAADRSKIDPVLKGGSLVFVRMDDQLFTSASAFPDFVTNETRGRTALRDQVVAELKLRSDESWAEIEPAVNELESAGEIKSVERFWLVNGFIASATVKAIEALSERDDVSYIMRSNAAERKPQSQAAWGPSRPIKSGGQTTLPAEDQVGWNVKEIGAFDCWVDEQVTGAGVVVAVADDGMIPTPSLTAALWVNDDETADGVDNDNNGYVDDLYGYRFRQGSGDIFNPMTGPTHGTACAGIIAGRPSQRTHFMTGLAPDARVMPLVDGGLMLRLEYALENGADIFSMSFSMGGASPATKSLYRTALEHATAAGLVCAGGAGNYRQSSPKGAQIHLPKSVPCVICVGGVTRQRTLAPFSSEGPVSWEGVPFYGTERGSSIVKPDVVAFPLGYPVWGTEEVTRTRRKWRVLDREPDGAALVLGPQGNSFSGPHAAGVAALMLSAHPELTPWRLKEILEQTANDLGRRRRNPSFGDGLIDALAAVRAAKADASR